MAENEVVPGMEAKPDVSEVEQQALDMGWRPKSQWEGDPDEWKSAKQFVKDKGLFDYIDSLKATVNSLKKDFREVHHKISASERAKYEEKLVELTAQKKIAAREGDTEQVEELREQIDEAKAKLVGAAQPQQQGPNPDFVSWVSQNSWYTNDLTLQKEADGFANAFIATNQEADFKQVLNHVTSKMKKLYPERFGVTQKQTAPSVEGSTPTPRRGGTKFSESDLPADAIQVMNTFVKQKIYDTAKVKLTDQEAKERYIKEYMQARGA